MAYLAAMTGAYQFTPAVTINNESGLEYHFGCAACSVLSVVAQWT